MQALVSVVIPNYNNGQYLAEAISSVMSQTYKNIEIIVIDDGSTDDSNEILESFGSKILLIKQKNQGAASARNQGIRSAKGDYIAFLDSDDIWKPNKVELQVSKIQSSEHGFVYCSLQEFFSDGSLGRVHLAKFEGYCYSLFKRYPHSAIIVGGCSTALIKTSILSNSIFFDETFKGVGEDLDFFRKLCQVSSVGVITDVLVSYRRHDKNLTAVSKIEYFEGNLKAVSKLIAEDAQISRFEARIVYIRMISTYLKTFAKIRSIKNFIHVFFMLFRRSP
jgi:glycosyltransferase involved in cell wall biosynthesis